MLKFRQNLHIRVTKADTGQQIFCRMTVTTDVQLSNTDMSKAASHAAKALLAGDYPFTALELARRLSEQNPDWDITLPNPGCLVDIRFASGHDIHTATVSCGD